MNKESFDYLFRKRLKLSALGILLVLSTTTSTLLVLPIDTKKSLLIYAGISLPLIIIYSIYFLYILHKNKTKIATSNSKEL
jgi:hypothetical protein